MWLWKWIRGRGGQSVGGVGVPLKPLPPEAVQAGEGDPWGLSTGAKALFCLAADGNVEKGSKEEEEEEPGIVGLEGMTAGMKGKGDGGKQLVTHHRHSTAGKRKPASHPKRPHLGWAGNHSCQVLGRITGLF